MIEDLRSAIRSLRHSPAFTLVALAVLALGIGAGTAIFTIVDAVVLRGLPFDEHDRLVAVLEHDTRRPETFGGGTTTLQMYLDWRELQDSFDSLAAIHAWTFPMRNERGELIDVPAYRVTWEFFPALRAAPVLGRSFTPEDEIDGRHRVLILGYGFWQRRFGGAADAIGRTIQLNDQAWEVIGVMPRGFEYPVATAKPADLFTPVPFRPEDRIRRDNRNYNYTAIGRLKDGVSAEQAQERMNQIAAGLDQQYPKWSPGRRVRVVTLHHHLVGRVRGWMLMLLGAVALVLLIACANVANLMLARATSRAREMGIRAALGAGRWRLVRSLLIEGLVLSFAGAAVGVLLAYFGVEIIRAWMPANVPRVAGIRIDLRVLGATIAASVLTGITFGLVPALHSSRPDLHAALKDTGRSTTAGKRTQWLRSTLVVVEVALAVVLVAGSGLFVGSFVRLMRVDLGIDPHNVLALNVYVPITNGDFKAAKSKGNAYLHQMLEGVRAVPGVQHAEAVSGGLPLTGSWSRTGITLPGWPPADGDNSIDRRLVTPAYLQLLRIPLVRGRYLTDADRQGSDPVMVINQTAARKYWPDQDPIGQRATISGTERTIVGIVADIRHLGPESPARQECYIPIDQEQITGATLTLRTAGDPLAALPAIKSAIWNVNANQRLSSETVTLEGYMDRLIAQRRFNMSLIGLFGLLGLLIAAVGIYGVMTYLVTQRTNEIGVRMALGATRGNVVAMILKRASMLVVAGLAIGTAVAWPLSTALQVRSFLFQVEPGDKIIYGTALAALALSGLLASAIPARRAASIDPLAALRHD